MTLATIFGVALGPRAKLVAGAVLDDSGTPVIGLPDEPTSVGGLEILHSPDDTHPDIDILLELAVEARRPLPDVRALFPFAARVSDRTVEARCERLLDLHREHLVDVCLNPRVRVDAADDVVDLSRARRIGSRGMAWIAARPDHWAGRRGGVPVPARVLAEQPQLSANTYENRVVGRLLDQRIPAHLRERLRRLRSLGSQAEQYQAALGYGVHDVRTRMANLWSEWWASGSADNSASEAADRISERIAALEELLHWTRRLVSTPRSVYRKLPKRRQVPPVLKRTNVFRGDDRYHRVGQLWEAFGPAPSLSTEERLDRQRTAAVGHAVFVRAVVLRAVEIGLPWSNDRLAFEVRDHGRVVLTPPGAAPLHIVPLFAEGEPETIGPLLPRVQDRTLVVIRPDGESDSPSPWTASNDQLMVAAESPRNVLAIESMAVLLRRQILGVAYRGLPPRVTARGDERATLRYAEVKFDVVDERDIALRCPVPEPQLERATEHRLRSLRGPRLESASLMWDGIRQAIAAANQSWTLGLVCPTRGCVAAVRIEDVDPTRVIVGCSAGHRWGRVCCAGGHEVPFATARDDPEALDRAQGRSSIAVLGARMVTPLAVIDGAVQAECSTCGDWTRVPVAPR